MNEVRIDPLTGDVVVLSPARIPAPPAFEPGVLPEVSVCPFCPGAEGLTESTIQQMHGPQGWLARAFPNRTPALRPHETGISRDGVLEGGPGVGAHEVVVGRSHDALCPHALGLAVERTRDLRRDGRFAAVSWFANRGVEAGASQPHPHLQVVATPIVPRRLAGMVERMARIPGGLQALVALATSDRRVVLGGEHIVAFCPWAPAVPYEVWLAPRVPSRWMSESPHIEDIGAAWRSIHDALDRAFGWCSTHTVAFDAPNVWGEGFCWHVRIRPVLTRMGGFECWSGGALQPVDPAAAAAVLRGFVP